MLIRGQISGEAGPSLHWYSDGPANVEMVLRNTLTPQNMWFGHDGLHDQLLSELDGSSQFLVVIYHVLWGGRDTMV